MVVMATSVTMTTVMIVVVPWSSGWCFRRGMRVPMIVLVMVMVEGHQSASGWASAMCSSMSASTPETC